MELPEFNQRFQQRAEELMWFLGAGASAAANIPTAGQMIWDFKRRLYCAAQRVPLSACEDTGDPNLRSILQHYFDAQGTFPREGADEEYAAYFEALYPNDGDRRRYIQSVVEGGKPSFGHLALSVVAAIGRLPVVWTTNFDRVLEDALAQTLGSTSRITVSTIDSAQIAQEALNESRRPLLVKLHGDFQSRRLKNIGDELREQDVRLREALVDSTARLGLVVVGYSGRDGSVMEALEAAVEAPRPFPFGLFWCIRADSPPSERVKRLIARAREIGIDADFVHVETFDELLGDLSLLLEGVPDELREKIDRRASRVTDAPIPPRGSSYPVIRFNAVRIEVPSLARLVECSIGGHSEIVSAIASANATIVAARKKAGVIAYGLDSEVRRTFETFSVSRFDVHRIETRRLRFADSSEAGLFLDTLRLALERERPLRVERRRGSVLIKPLDEAIADPIFAALTAATKSLGGPIGKTGVYWRESARLRLDFRLGRTWLLIEPTVTSDRVEEPTLKQQCADFLRERIAVRRNRETNACLDGWLNVLVPQTGSASLAAYGFPVESGVDATFTVFRKTAFSRRAS